MDEFPDQLRAWRLRNGWTQKQAATFLGLGLRALQQYEQSKRQPSKFVERVLRREFHDL
jgi:transcriptional regulator with XRE-family HTH domain